MGTSTWRQRQANETRRQILHAARHLFVSPGYVGTTVEAIAGDAGVAVATVYKAFGSKAAIARELNDLIDDEADVVGYQQRLGAATEPAELIGLAVALDRSLQEHCGDIIAATSAAALADATLARVYAEGTRRHDEGMRWVIDKLETAEALRPGLERAQATGLLSTLCSTEAFADLISRHGWSVDQCETWTVDALSRLLLKASEDEPPIEE
jgi:AcrR family transcriptional regulator